MKMNKRMQYEQVFKHFDENGDGKISPEELQQCVSSICRRGVTGGDVELSIADAEVAVELFDADGDGLLGLEDFIRFVDGGDEDEKLKDLMEAFKMYQYHDQQMDGGDDGGNGCECITPKSLKRMLSKLGVKRSIDECVVMISYFDLNGDGVLNFDEFKIMMS